MKPRLRVRYAETDQMGVVTISNHLVWFEIGRVELLRQMGFLVPRHGARRWALHRRG